MLWHFVRPIYIVTWTLTFVQHISIVTWTLQDFVWPNFECNIDTVRFCVTYLYCYMNLICYDNTGSYIGFVCNARADSKLKTFDTFQSGRLVQKLLIWIVMGCMKFWLDNSHILKGNILIYKLINKHRDQFAKSWITLLLLDSEGQFARWHH